MHDVDRCLSLVTYYSSLDVMPRFPNLDQVALPVHFERVIAGKLHADGRRYLPLLVLRLRGGGRIGVVDRHHVVAPDAAGREGAARLVFLLSNVRLQPHGERRQAIVPDRMADDHVSTAPDVFGRVVAVPTWEVRSGDLPYDVVYMELLLNVGTGVVGLRTNVTADDLPAKLGTERFAIGDWVQVSRSRVDILGFDVA
jgi:hypothetical protein